MASLTENWDRPLESPRVSTPRLAIHKPATTIAPAHETARRLAMKMAKMAEVSRLPGQ